MEIKYQRCLFRFPDWSSIDDCQSPKKSKPEVVIPLEDLSPLANPLAQKKLLKKLHKTVKKGMSGKIVADVVLTSVVASKGRMIKRGVKEVVKGIKKGEKGQVACLYALSSLSLFFQTTDNSSGYQPYRHCLAPTYSRRGGADTVHLCRVQGGTWVLQLNKTANKLHNDMSKPKKEKRGERRRRVPNAVQGMLLRSTTVEYPDCLLVFCILFCDPFIHTIIPLGQRPRPCLFPLSPWPQKQSPLPPSTATALRKPPTARLPWSRKRTRWTLRQRASPTRRCTTPSRSASRTTLTHSRPSWCVSFIRVVAAYS